MVPLFLPEFAEGSVWSHRPQEPAIEFAERLLGSALGYRFANVSAPNLGVPGPFHRNGVSLCVATAITAVDRLREILSDPPADWSGCATLSTLSFSAFASGLCGTACALTPPAIPPPNGFGRHGTLGKGTV